MGYSLCLLGLSLVAEVLTGGLLGCRSAQLATKKHSAFAAWMTGPSILFLYILSLHSTVALPPPPFLAVPRANNSCLLYFTWKWRACMPPGPWPTSCGITNISNTHILLLPHETDVRRCRDMTLLRGTEVDVHCHRLVQFAGTGCCDSRY